METFKTLKARHREERDTYAPALSVRVHRALSWLKKAEKCEDDDSKFMFLWVAFNAAYAQEFDRITSYNEQGLYKEFLDKLVAIDKEKKLNALVWSQYSGAIRLILDNEFILKAYWDYHSGKIAEDEWKKRRSDAKASANTALSRENTTTVLSIVFSRLYVLRNQMMHGGATYGSSANRAQLRDCTSILEQIIPVIIGLMMDGKNELWGDPVYPLVIE